MAGPGRLPLWAWLLPLATAVAAVVSWTGWCGSETGTWLGGALVAVTGLLVYTLSLEALPQRRGAAGALVRLVAAVLLAVAGGGLVFVAAGAGYYLTCPPF